MEEELSQNNKLIQISDEIIEFTFDFLSSDLQPSKQSKNVVRDSNKLFHINISNKYTSENLKKTSINEPSAPNNVRTGTIVPNCLIIKKIYSTKKYSKKFFIAITSFVKFYLMIKWTIHVLRDVMLENFNPRYKLNSTTQDLCSNDLSVYIDNDDIIRQKKINLITYIDSYSTDQTVHTIGSSIIFYSILPIQILFYRIKFLHKIFTESIMIV